MIDDAKTVRQRAPDTYDDEVSGRMWSTPLLGDTIAGPQARKGDRRPLCRKRVSLNVADGVYREDSMLIRPVQRSHSCRKDADKQVKFSWGAKELSNELLRELPQASTASTDGASPGDAR
jgi:hypothetical protein